VLWKIFGPKREKFRGNWRKLSNEKLQDLSSSSNIIRMIKSSRKRWGEHVARMGEKKNKYRILVVKLEGKRPLGRPRHRYVDIIKTNLKKWEGNVDWIYLTQDRNKWRILLKTITNSRVPLNSKKFLTS
jgi:hypothetical protein